MKPLPSAADLLQVWRFIRGDIDSETFELWLVENEQMKAPLGRAWYVDLISTDYRHQRAVWEAQARLAEWANQVQPLRCACITYKDCNVTGDFHVFEEMEQKAAWEGPASIVVGIYRCPVCDEWWLAALDTRVIDGYGMRRMHPEEIAAFQATQARPADFASLESFLRFTAALGSTYRIGLSDVPWDSNLFRLFELLAHERPGIRVSEMAALFGIPLDVADRVAREVIAATGEEIHFDG